MEEVYGCSGYLQPQAHYVFSDYMQANTAYKECAGGICTDRSNSRNVVCGMLSTVVVMAAFAFISTLIVIFHPRAHHDFFKARNYSRF